MDSSEKFIASLKPEYFWDIDFQKINDVVNKRLIIERIFEYGSLNEINMVIEHYGKSDVINTLVELRYLQPKTLNFVAKLFDLPKIAFRCYTGNPLKNQHWDS